MIALGLAAAVVAAVEVTDLRSRRNPDWLVVPFLVPGFAFAGPWVVPPTIFGAPAKMFVAVIMSGLAGATTAVWRAFPGGLPTDIVSWRTPLRNKSSRANDELALPGTLQGKFLTRLRLLLAESSYYPGGHA